MSDSNADSRFSFPLRAAVALAATGFLYSSLSEAPAWREALSTRGAGSAGVWLWSVTAAGTVLLLARQALRAGWRDAAVRLVWMLALTGIVAGVLPHMALAVEQVHLLEYGGLALVYAWAVRPLVAGRKGLILAALLVFAAGVLDEWIQFHLDTRVGDLRDVWLNGLSAVLALVAADRVLWREPGWCVADRTRRLLAAAFASVLLLTAAFIEWTTTVGYKHETIPGMAFYSRFSLDELQRRNVSRAQEYAPRVRQMIPGPMHAYLKRQAEFDPYLAEILVRLFRRDGHARQGDRFSAWGENEILMQYFSEVVRLSDQTWTPERAAAMRPTAAAPYLSPVGAGDIRVRVTFGWLWGPTVLLVAFSVFWGFRARPRNWSPVRLPDRTRLSTSPANPS